MKNEKLQPKIINFLILLFGFTFFTLIFTLPALAQTPSPKPTPKVTSSPKATPATSPSPTSSPEIQGKTSVRDKVRETIERLTKNPQAVVGTLDQITDTTLQVKNGGGRLHMVATSDDTKYFHFTKGKRTDIKFEDLVINDFIAVLGYKNGNDIVDAKRVLSFDEKPFVDRRAIQGNVEAIGKNTLTINFKDETWTIEIGSKTKIMTKVDEKMTDIKLSDIKEGDKVVIAGVPNNKKANTLLAGTILDIPGSRELPVTPKPSLKPSPAPKSAPKPTP